MEFLIDKKFWNKVIKKSPASTGFWIKQNLTDWHTEKEITWFKKKEINPEYERYKWGEKYIEVDSSRTKVVKVGKYLKKDFVLNFPNTEEELGYYEIFEGFLYETCFAYEPENKLDHVPIEKVIIEILIKDYNLSKDVFYQGKPVIELEKWEPEVELEQDNLIETGSKGFVYLIRNDDIYKIGITDNLLRRFKQLKPNEVLNVVRCSNFESLEKDLHRKFKEFRIPGTEYFRLNKNQIEQVNIEMTKGADF